MSNDSRRDLGASLRKAGILADVEVRDGLAVLNAANLDAVAARRREIVALAQAHGFTHACVELLPEVG